MDRVDLSRDEPTLADLVDRAEAGESIEIVRNGKVAARLVPVRQPIDVDALRTFAKTLPYQDESAADLIRRMRDSGY